MPGAYTALPEEEEEAPDVPDGWNPIWPFPGPFPPGYTPTYNIIFIDPESVNTVIADPSENITFKVRLRDGTHKTNDPEAIVEFRAEVDQEVRWTGESLLLPDDGWYECGFDVNVNLTEDDITTTPKYLMVYAETTVEDQDVSDFTYFRIARPFSIDIDVGMLADGISATHNTELPGHPASWEWIVKLRLRVKDPGEAEKTAWYSYLYSYNELWGDETIVGPLWEPETDSDNKADGVDVSLAGRKIRVQQSVENFIVGRRFDLQYYCESKITIANPISTINMTGEGTGELEDSVKIVSSMSGGNGTPSTGGGWYHTAYFNVYLNTAFSSQWNNLSVSGTGIFNDATAEQFD